MKKGWYFIIIIALFLGTIRFSSAQAQMYNDDWTVNTDEFDDLWPDVSNEWSNANQPNPSMWIDCSQEQLLNGQCKFNIYDTLGIRQNSSQNEPAVFVQDAIFAATTFIGTVITIALIFSGLLFIRAGLSANEWLQERAKKWLINSVIGLLLVISSYMIIRLVQFIIRWW